MELELAPVRLRELAECLVVPLRGTGEQLIAHDTILSCPAQSTDPFSSPFESQQAEDLVGQEKDMAEHRTGTE